MMVNGLLHSACVVVFRPSVFKSLGMSVVNVSELHDKNATD